MNRISVGFVGISVLLIAGPLSIAKAADMSPAPVYKAPPPPPPVYSWTGFYIGGNAGGAWGNFDPSTSVVFSPTGYFATTSTPAITTAGTQSISPNGFTGGFEGGYNFQASNIVYGLEGDIESFRLSGNSTSGLVTYPCCAPTGFTVTSNASTSCLATARGRL